MANILPITVIIAVKNEAINLPHCLSALKPAERVIIVDSHSTDDTVSIARQYNVEVVQFDYKGGYPKKRQWTIENLAIQTPWIFLLDADEMITSGLWQEIAEAIAEKSAADAFMITKWFHFLGRSMRHGGFSHSAVLLFKKGKARFERLLSDDATGLDMEVHERVVVDGIIRSIHTPLIHEDFKGLEAYIARHNKYSTWEARLRYNFLTTGRYGEDTISPNLFGNSQERRRAIKGMVIKLPFEHWLWFAYHYFFKLGFLEGRAGLIASQLRASYIAQVRSKIHELQLRQELNPADS